MGAAERIAQSLSLIRFSIPNSANHGQLCGLSSLHAQSVMNAWTQNSLRWERAE